MMSVRMRSMLALGFLTLILIFSFRSSISASSYERLPTFGKPASPEQVATPQPPSAPPSEPPTAPKEAATVHTTTLPKPANLPEPAPAPQPEPGPEKEK